MEDKRKNRVLIIAIILGVILVFISLAIVSSSKKLTVHELLEKQKPLEVENNYQNINTGAFYETLAEALNTVADNQTIRVLKGKTETTAPTLASGKTGIKLDMNGQTTTLSGVALTNSGELDIYNSSLTEGKLTGSGTRTIINAGTLTTNGTNSTNKLLIINTSAVASARVIIIDVGKTATLNTNTYINFTTATTADRYVITANGTLTVAGATIENNSGSTTIARDRGLQVGNSAGKIRITSGTVNIPGMAVVVSNVTAGTEETTAVEVTGGTISSTSWQAIYNNHAKNKVLITGGNISSTNNNAVRNNSGGTINIAGGTITSSTVSSIRNEVAGEINVTGGIITGGTYGIYNNAVGTINVEGGTITGGTTGIYNNGTGTINVEGGTIIGETTGIYNNAAGIINVSGNSTSITGKTEYGVRGYKGTITVSGGTIKGVTYGVSALGESTASITITGGNIEATGGRGVYISGGGILTIGTNEQAPLVSTTEPSITGSINGVEVASSTFNFYDGIIVGKGGRTSIVGTASEIPSGYEVLKTTENGIETAILEKKYDNPDPEPVPGISYEIPENSQIFAGYSKICIDPDPSKGPIPLSGYGNTYYRTATFAEGDQEYKQSLYATAVAIKDSKNNIIIFVTLDLAAMSEDKVNNIRKAVTTKTGVPGEKVMISCTHTHSAPDISFSNSNYPELVSSVNAYNELLIENISEACAQAIQDLKMANVYIGTTDIVNEDGSNALNFVRHYETSGFYKNGDKVFRGDNHGDFVWNGTKYVGATRTKHATDADPTLQMIKFDFIDENNNDILMVNWQVHPHITGSSALTTISADLIASFREEVEKECNCRVAYYTGAGGNLNWSNWITDGSEGIQGVTYSEKNTTNEDKYNNSIRYGKILAQYVINNYNKLEKANVKTIKQKQERFMLNLRTINNEELLTNAQYCKTIWNASYDDIKKMIIGEYNWGANYEFPEGYDETGAKLREIINNYENLKSRFIVTGNDNDGYNCDLSSNITRSSVGSLIIHIGVDFDERIYSPYHANAVVRDSNTSRILSRNIEIDAVSIGDVSFVTAPYEMFDTNGKYIKDNSQSKMTFVLELANRY